MEKKYVGMFGFQFFVTKMKSWKLWSHGPRSKVENCWYFEPTCCRELWVDNRYSTMYLLEIVISCHNHRLLTFPFGVFKYVICFRLRNFDVDIICLGIGLGQCIRDVRLRWKVSICNEYTNYISSLFFISLDQTFANINRLHQLPHGVMGRSLIRLALNWVFCLIRSVKGLGF